MSSPICHRARLLVLAGATVLALTGCGRRSPAPPAPPPPVEVAVVTLAPQRVELTRELPGRTAAFLLAEVRPQVTGIVRSRRFEEGSRVTAGQILYELDDSTYRAEHESAQAQLERAQATLELARLNARRAEGLAQADAVSRQEYENAMASLRQHEAEVRAAEAALSRARVLLGYTRVTSPIDGRIGKSAVTPGALVTANQPEALAVVQQLDPIYVDVTQSSREWLELRRELDAGTLARAELPVTILLEDGSRYSHSGRLEFAEVAVDPATGSIGVRVVVPNPDHLLLPGMYVRAWVGTAAREDAILVPQPAVVRDPKGNASVMLVNSEDKVEVRPIRVSRTIGASWLVDDGLAAGERVIVQGLQKIGPGAPVKAVPAPEPGGDGSAAGAK